MTIERAEIAEIREWLGRVRPFDLLDDDLLREAATSCQVRYVPAGSVLADVGDDNNDVSVIVRGSVELRNEQGTLRARLGEGEMVGVVSALSGRPARHRCTVIEDAVLQVLDADLINRLRRAADTEFDQYLVGLVADRTPVDGQDRAPSGILARRCVELVTRPPVVAATYESVTVAARRMADEGVSSLVIIDDRGRSIGIITDRDLRIRVVAAGTDADTTTVGEIMTRDPLVIDGDGLAHEALLIMAERNIHHLPVVDDRGVTVGLITVTNLTAERSNDPVAVVGRVAKAETPDEVAAATAAVPATIAGLMAADATAEVTGRLVSRITDAATRRLCQLAEADLGPPPLDYAFVCFGSQARGEQTAFSDQDNAIVLARPPTDDEDEYFARLARFVCDGLDRAGYRYCPGDIMATNPRWRTDVDTWCRYVDAWVAEPDPEAVLNAAVFFEARHLHGEGALTERFHRHAVAAAAGNSLFLGQLAAEGAAFKPPLGFFRRFVLEKDGAQKDTLDLKRTGVTPVVLLARAYALRSGLLERNTYDRLRAIADSAAMASADAADLVVAFEYVGYVRLQHQRAQLARGDAADHYVDPDDLTRLEREQLRRAFKAIDAQQDALRRSFNTAAMG